MTEFQRPPLIAFLTPTLNPPTDSCSVTMGALDALRAAQPTVQFEHIVVDGGSSREALSIFAQDPHAQVVEAPGANISEALNIGWELSTARYVVVLCVGDAPRPSVVDAACRLQASGTDIGIFPVWDGAAAIRPTWRGSVVRSSWTHAGMLAERSLLESVGGYDRQFRFAMDWEWLSRAHRSGASCEMMPDFDPVIEIEPFGLSGRRFFSAQGELLDVIVRDCPGFGARMLAVSRYLPAYVKAMLTRR